VKVQNGVQTARTEFQLNESQKTPLRFCAERGWRVRAELRHVRAGIPHIRAAFRAVFRTSPRGIWGKKKCINSRKPLVLNE
jgi:hypothetical protein